MSDKDPAQNFPAGYEVPKTWTWEAGNGGQFASINRPASPGPRTTRRYRSASIRCSCIRRARRMV